MDRIEGGVAVIVCSDGELTMPATLLPEGAREGDHLRLELTIDHDARSAVKAEVDSLQKRLRGKEDDRGKDDSA
ncbi:MAG: DUF3006 domain-containing protein [Gaiellales bacterium]|nr:MAG: DUF3006 domain-containing protein [Gaiellales bacterium]